MNNLSQYSDILGEPGVGFHAARIGGFALWDIVGTFFLALIISLNTGYSYYKTTIVLFLLSIFLHWIFGVKTKSGMLLNLN